MRTLSAEFTNHHLVTISSLIHKRWMFLHEVTLSVLSTDDKSIIIVLTIKLRWRFASEQEAAIPCHSRQVCFHWSTLYCNFSLNFQVRNCGSYYVACVAGSLRFWGRRENSSLPPKSQTATNAGYLIRATVSYLEVEREVTIVSRPVKADLADNLTLRHYCMNTI